MRGGLGSSLEVGRRRPLRRVLLALAAAIVLQAGPVGAQTTAPEGPYVASSRGTVYYWIGCEAWRSLAPANLLNFRTRSEAEGAGYRASRAAGCAGPAGEAGWIPRTEWCTVDRIIDGDTLRCLETPDRVRLLLIDAPELSQGDWGEASRRRLARLIPDGTLTRLEIDVQERDIYGRILAYVYAPDGRMVNETMVREGYAIPVVYPPNVRYVELIRRAAEEARQARRGLWSQNAFDCLPSQARAGACR